MSDIRRVSSRRRGSTRLFACVTAAVAGVGAWVTPQATAAEQEADQRSVQLFTPDQFGPEAAELPAGLVEAIERDLDISAAQYLADAHAARAQADVVARLVDDGVSVEAAAIDDEQGLRLYVTGEADIAAVETIDGVQILDERPDVPDVPADLEMYRDPAALVPTEAVEPLAGTQVCHAESSTGFRCGEILAVGVEAAIGGNAVGGIVTDVCGTAGEPAAPLRSGAFTIGTLVGGSGPESGDCDDWDAGKHLSIGVAAAEEQDDDPPAEDDPPVEEGPPAEEDPPPGEDPPAGDDSSADDADAPDIAAPIVERPADGDVTGQVVRFEGTAPGAGEEHRVAISVDGGEPLETPVDGEGAFAVRLPDRLPLGTEHTYEARVLLGESSSDVVEGSFTVADEFPGLRLGVEIPADGQVFINPVPEFNGRGEPLSDISLTIDGEQYGHAIAHPFSWEWEMDPEPALPIGVRFDAVFTQVFEYDFVEWTDEVVVTDLGVRAPRVAITSPVHGSTVTGDAVFEGTSFAGATVTLRLVDDEDGTLVAGNANADGEPWPGEFDIDEQGRWTFTPDEPLEYGEYTVIAEATLEGGDPELSDSQAGVWFTASDGDELPDTGSSNLWMMLLGVALFAAGAAMAVRSRRT